jgi:signal transduction histidine kinase
LPFVFIHYARPTAELDARIGPVWDRAEKDKREVAADIARARARLRLGVAGVGVATFLGIVLGGPVLVRYGLRPLRRLSDAVSRVSEKDFRLPVEREDLSRELLPIHARLTDTLDDLRRAFEREKQAVADISHELRTPVAGMLATLDVTLRKPRSADQYRAALEETRAIGRQLAGLVERVMTLASLDAGADRTALVEIDAAEVAGRCATVVRPLAVANGLRFEADFAGPVPVVTDPDKLREVVTNFLHNAVEYNRPGGSIRLSVRPTPGGGAEVEVADTGIGMSADVRDKIFERFYRADASRHAAGAHAGLGLSIVKEYVHRLGGAVAVESAAGVGSTFRVTLPAAPAGADVIEPEPAVG